MFVSDWTTWNDYLIREDTQVCKRKRSAQLLVAGRLSRNWQSECIHMWHVDIPVIADIPVSTKWEILRMCVCRPLPTWQKWAVSAMQVSLTLCNVYELNQLLRIYMRNEHLGDSRHCYPLSRLLSADMQSLSRQVWMLHANCWWFNCIFYIMSLMEQTRSVT